MKTQEYFKNDSINNYSYTDRITVPNNDDFFAYVINAVQLVVI